MVTVGATSAAAMPEPAVRRRTVIASLPVLLIGATQAAAAGPDPVEVRDNGLFGRFYAAPGAKRSAAVLMLGGSNGGYPYDAAARDLAAAGYPTLALAYFRDFQGRPAELPQARLSEVPLEYIFAGLEWLKARPEVDPRRVAVMGESRGGELALQIGSLRRDVAGVIAYVPSNLRWGAVGGGGKGGWTLSGQTLPFASGRFNPADPMAEFTGVLDGPEAARTPAEIEVEKINGPVLLISTTSDRIWPSARFADLVEARLKAKGFRHPVRNVKYDDASHLLMGFGKGQTQLKLPTFTVNFGGSEEGTERARNAGWAEAKAFLAKLPRHSG